MRHALPWRQAWSTNTNTNTHRNSYARRRKGYTAARVQSPEQVERQNGAAAAKAGPNTVLAPEGSNLGSAQSTVGEPAECSPAEGAADATRRFSAATSDAERSNGVLGSLTISLNQPSSTQQRTGGDADTLGRAHAASGAAANALAPQATSSASSALRQGGAAGASSAGPAPEQPALSNMSVDMTDMYDMEDTQLPDIGVLLLATAVGLSTGVGVVMFNSLVHTVQDDLIWTDAPRIAAFGSFFLQRDPVISLWQYLLIPPIIGGMAVSVLRQAAGGFDGDPKCVKALPPAADAPAAGAPAPPLLARIWGEDRLSTLRPYVKFLAAALTLGSGASLGPEGPSVELGKANAAAVGQVAKNQEAKITTDLLAAGAGAGVAAGFGAPMAGVVFAVETVLLAKRPTMAAGSPANPGSKEVEMTTDDGGLLITTVLIACVIASIVSHAGIGIEAAFRVPEYETLSLDQLPLFIILGLLCGVTSSSILSLCRSSERSLMRMRLAGVPAYAMPVIGGLACGSLAMVYPEITYQGFDNVNALLRLSSGSAALYSASVLTQLVIVKGIATAVCRSSGLVGGLYAPSLFIGAAVGSAFCMVCQGIFDTEVVRSVVPFGSIDLLADSSGYALVGAAAMLAAKCKVPLTSVLLLFELTHDYTIVIPTLATVGIARWASATADKKIRPKS